MTSPTAATVEAATARLLETADRLPDTDWGAPSICVGWSRAHVLAHVALNAEGLGGAVIGLVTDTPTTMYRSNEARNADIEALAAEPPDVIRARLRSSAAVFAEALRGLPSLDPDAGFDRTPGGRLVQASAVPILRLREVEIHHADLDCGYTHADWPEETVGAFLDLDARRYTAGPGFLAHATDLGRDWEFGTPEPGAQEVSGPGSALAWWATGRTVPQDAGGAVLSCTDGDLPAMEGR